MGDLGAEVRELSSKVHEQSSTIQQLELVCDLIGLPDWDREQMERCSPYTNQMLQNLNVSNPKGVSHSEWCNRFPGASGWPCG